MRGPRERGEGVETGRTQFIALTSPCGGGIGMQRAGGPACSRSGGGHIVGCRVPSIPAGCPVRRLSSSGPSSLAGGVGVSGSRRWGSCPCTGCPVAGSGGGSVGAAGSGDGSVVAAAAGVDWSVGWAFVCCCQCLSVCWLVGVRTFVCCCQCLSVCWLAGVRAFVCCCQCLSVCWLAGVRTFVCCCQCLSVCWLAGVEIFVCCCQCLSVCWLAGVGVCGGRGSTVSARRGPPRVGLCCPPRCWPLVVLGAGRRVRSERCPEPQR